MVRLLQNYYINEQVGCTYIHASGGNKAVLLFIFMLLESNIWCFANEKLIANCPFCAFTPVFYDCRKRRNYHESPPFTHTRHANDTSATDTAVDTHEAFMQVSNTEKSTHLLLKLCLNFTFSCHLVEEEYSN